VAGPSLARVVLEYGHLAGVVVEIPKVLVRAFSPAVELVLALVLLHNDQLLWA
jgi:hypothetical protein